MGTNQLLYKIAIAVIALLALLVLVQVWLEPFSIDVFGKLVATLVVVIIVAVLVYFLKQHFTKEQQLRDDKYID
jgi:protein-S-isoprenylcysteine O-methyltransferase Ste14